MVSRVKWHSLWEVLVGSAPGRWNDAAESIDVEELQRRHAGGQLHLRSGWRGGRHRAVDRGVNYYATSSFTSFNALGRVLASNQQTLGQTYGFSYSYNLAGGLTSETYPSGRVVTNSFDAQNRPYATTGNYARVLTDYVSGTSYWPHGAIYYFVRGNNVWHAAGYNNRLQPTETYEAVNNRTTDMLCVSCLNWGVQPNFGNWLYGLCPVSSATNDNGTLQLATYENGGPGYRSFLTFNDYYWYDGLNRVTAGNGKDVNNNLLWAQNFGYDRYGNRWVGSTGGLPVSGATPTSNVFTGANQISGVAYDAAGNQLSVNGNTVAYDPENHQTSVTEPAALGGATEYYGYDGNGVRVQKSGPGGIVGYVYDAFGHWRPSTPRPRRLGRHAVPVI